MTPPAPVSVLRASPVLALLVLFLSTTSLNSQTSSTPQAPSANTRSLADVLKNRQHPLHILYVHGIGVDGPTDLDSYYLRRGICEMLHCNKRDGEMVGELVFANIGQFRAHATPPSVFFLGQTVFPVDASGGSELWDASAPFLRRFKLAIPGSPLYVDELNWWPLVFAIKCRYVVAPDAALVGLDKTNLKDCSRDKVPYGATGHFSSYPFISKQEAAQLGQLPKRGALLNRNLKSYLMDWGFSDAVLSIGPMRQVLVDGLRQLIRLAMQPPDGDPSAAGSQEFVIVAHSLGSYLIFAALDSTGSNPNDSAQNFSYVLAHTSRVYFLANQLRLMEMANLDLSLASNFNEHLTGWVNARTAYLSSAGIKANENPLQIIAWNDASDLLTWEMPPICGVEVENHTVRNTFNWFGLAENPTKAHNYGLNRKVIHGVLNSSFRPEPQACPATSVASPALTPP